MQANVARNPLTNASPALVELGARDFALCSLVFELGKLVPVMWR